MCACVVWLCAAQQAERLVESLGTAAAAAAAQLVGRAAARGGAPTVGGEAEADPAGEARERADAAEQPGLPLGVVGGQHALHGGGSMQCMVAASHAMHP